VNVVIETPRHSRIKYSWEHEHDCMMAKKVMPLGSSFPYDFGFIPGTKAEDGDPIDVLLLVDEPLAPGTMLTARLIGVIEAEQTERANSGGDTSAKNAKKKNGKKKPEMKWERNDRLIAVAEITIEYQEVEHIRDLPETQLKQIIAFFEQYNRLSGKEFKALGTRGPKTALRLLHEAIAQKPGAKEEKKAA
jgi:inorganic pyrophosphatase